MCRGKCGFHCILSVTREEKQRIRQYDRNINTLLVQTFVQSATRLYTFMLQKIFKFGLLFRRVSLNISCISTIDSLRNQCFIPVYFPLQLIYYTLTLSYQAFLSVHLVILSQLLVILRFRMYVALNCATLNFCDY